MTLQIIRLGSPRQPDEGLRLGTVRRPPRGVAKADHARLDYYDQWLPQLAPSDALVKRAQAADDAKHWAEFVRKFRAEMARPDNARLLDLLAALSRQTNFSLGCYCAEEARCHRSVLRALLAERGAKLGPGPD